MNHEEVLLYEEHPFRYDPSLGGGFSPVIFQPLIPV